MGDHQNGLLIVPGRPAQKIHHVPAALGVEISRRLVRENKRRTGNQRPPDGHPLLLSAGKLSRQMLPPVFQTQHLQDLIHPTLIRLPVIQQQREDDVLLHVQLRDQMKGLKDKADILSAEDSPFILVHGKYIPPVQIYFPGVGLVQPSDTV